MVALRLQIISYLHPAKSQMAPRSHINQAANRTAEAVLNQRGFAPGAKRQLSGELLSFVIARRTRKELRRSRGGVMYEHVTRALSAA